MYVHLIGINVVKVHKCIELTDYFSCALQRSRRVQPNFNVRNFGVIPCTCSCSSLDRSAVTKSFYTGLCYQREIVRKEINTYLLILESCLKAHTNSSNRKLCMMQVGNIFVVLFSTLLLMTTNSMNVLLLVKG